jgi:hypothetical protein
MPVCIWTASSAAIGISTRSALGKLRHLETHMLWFQEKVRTGMIGVRKVRGEVKPANLFTKHLPSKDKIHQLTSLFGCEYRTGRAEGAPLLRPHSSDGQKVGHLPVEGLLPHFNIVFDKIEPHDECTAPSPRLRLRPEDVPHDRG